MLKGWWLFASCLVALTLSACASSMSFTEMNPSILPEDQDSGRIFFYRPIRIKGTYGVSPVIRLNDTKVGVSIARGFFYVDRPPGIYTVATSPLVDRNVIFRLERGQTRFVRIDVYAKLLGGGDVHGGLVDSTEALEEIKACSYRGAQTTPK